MTIMNKYSFPVELIPMYFYGVDYKGNKNVCPVDIGGSRQYAIVRTDKNEALGLCTKQYKIIKHEEVADYLKHIISSLGYNVEQYSDKMWQNGAIMNMFAMLDTRVKIGKRVLKAAIVGVNSYNKTCAASIRVKFVDTEDNTICGGEISGIKIMTNAIIRHNTSSDLGKFKTLSEWIPKYVNNIINVWSDWEAQKMSGARVKLLSMLTTMAIARSMEANGWFVNGCSRFEFYREICKFLVNYDTYENTGKSGEYKLSVMRSFLLDETLFDETKNENTEYAINYTKANGSFDWEDPNLGVRKRRRLKTKDSETQKKPRKKRSLNDDIATTEVMPIIENEITNEFTMDDEVEDETIDNIVMDNQDDEEIDKNESLSIGNEDEEFDEDDINQGW